MRTTIRSISIPLIALAGLFVIACTARAKVASASLDGIWNARQGAYISRAPDEVSLVLAPLVMESIHGNPYVRIAIYRAEGRTTDPSMFTKIRTITRRFLDYEYQDGSEREVRLDSVYTYHTLDTMLRDLRGDSYSLYVTADDGEGETAPSNVITIDLPPIPSKVVGAPVIEEITSPAIGLVVMRLAPMHFLGPGVPTLYFNVYQGDGGAADPAGFAVVTLGTGPWDMSDQTSTGIGDVRQIIVAGVKSGPARFYVTVKTEAVAGVESLPSNIVTVNVAGARSINDPFISLMHILPPSGVPLAGAAPLAAAPNPAADFVRLPLPAGDGDATVRIVDLIAGNPIEAPGRDAGGYCVVGVAGLAPGRYWALVSRGGHTIRCPFLVVR